MNTTRIAAAVAGLALAGGMSSAARADAVLHWNEVAGNAARAACISPDTNPLHESRLYAMVHLAVHDALNAIDRRAAPYAYAGPAAPGASPDAAVAAAAHGVLVAELPDLPLVPLAPCIDGALAVANDAFAAALAAIPNGAAEDAGVAVGHAAAAAVVALRDGDGSEAPLIDFAYPDGTAPGEYRRTSEIPIVFATQWENVTPFALERADQFRPRGPYPVSCVAPATYESAGSCQLYARDFDEVKAYGGRGANARSADETDIALFWLESSPLAWNRIARAAAGSFGYDLWEHARLFGLLNMALADGYIASNAAKYYFRFWRPETAIRLAATDGNPWTVADPAWLPLAPTPPVPDHDSAHAVQGGAAAEVMRRFFGTDHVSFSSCSLSSGTCRSFGRFSEASAENALSRILVGYHFRNATVAGLKHGERIGAEAVRRHLRPVHGANAN